jgi:hypothetical protein
MKYVLSATVLLVASDSISIPVYATDRIILAYDQLKFNITRQEFDRLLNHGELYPIFSDLKFSVSTVANDSWSLTG